jgi:hypothetical protein
MPYPNDMSRIAQGVGNYSASKTDMTAAASIAGRNLIRRTYVLTKPAADAMAADTTAYTAAFQMTMRCAGKVLGARIQPQAALTANASNNATINVVSADGAGGAAVVAASYTSDVAGGSLAAGVRKALTLSATAANTRYAVDQVLSFNIAKTGTGVVVPILSISVDVEEEGTDGYV